ncbi:MAG: hypothetical protein WD077_13150 [Bacteroidia bacterium]
MKIQYITNKAGEQKAVIVPLEECEYLNQENTLLQKKSRALIGIKAAMKEVNQIREGKEKKGRTLCTILDES